MLVDSFDEDNKDQAELAIKILIIGDSRVGKTSLLLKYVDKSFPEEHISTIGVEYKEKVESRDGFNIRLQIWDTAGEERFRSITKSIYKNTHGVLFVYDITQKETFANVKHWIKDTENIDKEIKGIIVGNKIDLPDKVITKTDLDEIGEKYNMPVIEVSAKEGTNVNECFDLLINELFKNKTNDQIKETYLRKAKSDLSISSKAINANKKKKCC
jgi:small GTP-binding protein